jgi:hemoglobin/transferrin/lactoferrin receptor protein
MGASGLRIGLFSGLCAAGITASGGQVAGAATNAPTGTAETPPLTETIVVTAARDPRDVQSLPVTAYAIGGEGATVERAARTSPAALSGLPSVMAQKTGYSQGSPYLRGFTGFRTLGLVDGIRLNNSVFRDGPNQYWNTIDPLSVRDYEVVMGPASVLYGSDAIGGVMNAVPIESPAWDGAPAWDRRVFYRGATAERSNTGRVQVGGRPSEALGFVGGVSLKDYGDLEGGSDVGTQPHTGYDERDYDGRIDYELAPDARLTLGHQTVEQDDAWRTHKTVYGTDWEGLSVGDEKVRSLDQRRDLTYMRLAAADLGGAVDDLVWTVSRHAQSEDQYRVRADDRSEWQGFDVVTWGTSLQLASDTDAGRWVYGAEYDRDGVDSYQRNYKADGSLKSVGIQGPVADDAAYESVATYVEDTVTVLDGALDVTPGVRWSYARADADRVQDPVTGEAMSVDGDWDAVVGSLRLLHPLSEDRRHVVFGGVAQGFRAPNLSDLTRLDTARSNEIETPVSDLDPERYLAGEIGWRSRFDRLTTQLGYYYTAIDSMIVRAPTGQTIDGAAEVTKKNSGDGYVQGVELSARYSLDGGWSTWGSASWMDGEVDAYPTSSTQQERDTISRLMPPTVQAGLRWQSGAARWWWEGVCDAAEKADRLSADDERDTQRIPPGGTPGYAVFTTRVGTTVLDGLALSLGLENILDEDYRIHGSGVNEPGRNWVLAADCTF